MTRDWKDVRASVSVDEEAVDKARAELEAKIAIHNERDEIGQFLFDRMTQEDTERSPGDPVRKGRYDPCCLKHGTDRYCLEPEGHDV